MNIIIILISISLTIAIIFLIAFIWSIKHGEFDDTETPAVRMLFDNEKNLER